MRVKTGEYTADEVHKDVDDDQTDHDGIQDVALIFKQHRAGHHAVNHERAHEDGGCTVTGNAQREHGNHGRAARAIVGRFGSCDALDFTLTEGFGVFRGLLGLIIGDERRQTAARAGGCTDNDADKRAERDGFAAAAIFVAGNLVFGDGGGADVLAIGLGIKLRFHHNFRDREQTDERDDQVDAAHEVNVAEGEAGGAADVVHTDGGHKDTDTSTDEALKDTLIGHACDDRQAEDCEREVFSGAKEQGNLGNLGC